MGQYRECVKYRYSWDAEYAEERRLTQILLIISKKSASLCVFCVIRVQ